jgi:hypothetical protein
VAGKPTKLALVAYMRKLLVAVCTVARTRRPSWFAQLMLPTKQSLTTEEKAFRVNLLNEIPRLAAERSAALR